MRMCVMAGVLAALSGAAHADLFNDNTGNHLAGGDLHDFFASQGFNHLDIVSVGVTNDATNLYFDIQLNADLDATNWGNYIVALNNGSGAASDNPWGPRPMDWNGELISHWIGTWANDGGSAIGGQLWSHDGAAWNQLAGLSGSDDSQHATGHQMFSVALADLGVGVGDVVRFDVMSSGGGGSDPGVDHLSRSDFATDGWGTGSVAGEFLSYTVVPTPGVLGLMGLGVLAGARRRR